MTVDFASANDDATVADGDFAAASGTLTFAPGDNSETATVQVNGDTKDEPNEEFQVILSNPGNATTRRRNRRRHDPERRHRS